MLRACCGVLSLSVFSRSSQVRQAVSEVSSCSPSREVTSTEAPALVERLKAPASRFTSRLRGPGTIPAEAKLAASGLPGTTLRTVATQQCPSIFDRSPLARISKLLSLERQRSLALRPVSWWSFSFVPSKTFVTRPLWLLE